MLEKRRIKIAMLSEVSATGLGAEKYTKRRGPFRIIGKGKVAVVIHKSVLRGADAKEETKPKAIFYGPRVMAVWIRGRWYAALYQPETISRAAKREELESYKIAREKLMAKIGNSASAVFGGDHNAAIGESVGLEEFREKGTIGSPKLLPTGSVAGKDLVEWAEENRLWIPDTFKAICQRGTWRLVAGTRAWYELDYFLATRDVQMARMNTLLAGFRTDHKMKIMFIRLGETAQQKTHSDYVKKLKNKLTGVKLPFTGRS